MGNQLVFYSKTVFLTLSPAFHFLCYLYGESLNGNVSKVLWVIYGWFDLIVTLIKWQFEYTLMKAQL